MSKYYEDDDDYYNLKSETPKQLANRKKHELPSVEEMKDTLINASRQGVGSILNSWISRCRSENTLDMLHKVKEAVSSKEDLQNRNYNFHLTTRSCEYGYEKVLIYGKEGKTPKEIKGEEQVNTESVQTTQSTPPVKELVFQAKKVVPGVSWASVVKK